MVISSETDGRRKIYSPEILGPFYAAAKSPRPYWFYFISLFPYLAQLEAWTGIRTDHETIASKMLRSRAYDTTGHPTLAVIDPAVMSSD